MDSVSDLYKTDSEGEITQSGYPHIVFKTTGVPMIAGTRIKIQVIATANQSWGLSPEQILCDYEGLTMGQIHSALAYYWDHKEELDRQIKEDEVFVEEVRRLNEPRQKELMRKLVERAKEKGIV